MVKAGGRPEDIMEEQQTTLVGHHVVQVAHHIYQVMTDVIVQEKMEYQQEKIYITQITSLKRQL